MRCIWSKNETKNISILSWVVSLVKTDKIGVNKACLGLNLIYPARSKTQQLLTAECATHAHMHARKPSSLPLHGNLCLVCRKGGCASVPQQVWEHFTSISTSCLGVDLRPSISTLRAALLRLLPQPRVCLDEALPGRWPPEAPWAALVSELGGPSHPGPESDTCVVVTSVSPPAH